MKVGLVAALTLLATSPVLAKRPACPEPRARQIAQLIERTNGDVVSIVARVKDRLDTLDVACWAARGDKPMTLELAKRLETGDGIAKDAEGAEELYVAAATPKSNVVYVYTPGVGPSAGRTVAIRTGPDIPGLPEAGYRRALMHIEGRAARPSPRKGFALLKKLAKQGYAPAAARLASLPRT